MRKLLKFTLIFGGLLLIAGGILFVIAYRNQAFTKNDAVNKSMELEEDFTNIRFNTAISDIEFIYDESLTKTKINYQEKDKLKEEILVKNNTLFLTEKDSYKWYEKIFRFNFYTLKIKVYLPKNTFDGLRIDSSTGDVIMNGFNFNTFNYSLSTGSLQLTNVNVVNEIKGSSSTGDVKLLNVNASSLDIKLSTGSISLNNVLIANTLKAKCSTGDIHLTKVDAKDIYLETSTGDILGDILSAKTFDAKTSTGSCNVPNTTGGTCYLRTSTGDIHITIA